MRQFPNGISRLSFMQGTDYVCLLQQLPFLIADSGDSLMPQDQLNHLLRIFRQLLKIAFTAYKVYNWTNSVRAEFDKNVKELEQLLTHDSFSHMSKKLMCIPNVHFLYHLTDYATLYGSPMNFETSQSEMAHKKYAKESFKRTNRHGDFLSSMMERNLLSIAVDTLAPLALSDDNNKEFETSNTLILPKNMKDIYSLSSKRLNPQRIRVGLQDLVYKLNLSQEIEDKRLSEIESKTLVCSVATYCYISNSPDFIVACDDYRSKGPRYDWIEIKQEENDTRWFAQVQAILHTMGRIALLVKTCNYVKTKKNCTGLDEDGHPVYNVVGLNHPVLQDSPHITWQKLGRQFLWNAVYESEVIARKHVIELPNSPNEFLVNDSVIL